MEFAAATAGEDKDCFTPKRSRIGRWTMRLRIWVGGLALAAAIAGPASADDNIKIGFITKFPVPFFATETAAVPRSMMNIESL